MKVMTGRGSRTTSAQRRNVLTPKIKESLKRLSAIFTRASGANSEQLEELLLEADVGVKCTRLLMDRIKNDPERLKREVAALIGLPPPVIATPRPIIIMVCGVNGSGKTTTIAKLAYYYRKTNTVLLACADTYRDAASEQLDVWAHRAGVDLVRSQKGQDAGAVVYDAISKAMIKGVDYVLIDTAGRLQTRTDLMAELKKMRKVVAKLKPAGPDLVLLTIDATLGQNSIQQARLFTAECGVNGIVLTKLDGTAKGGAIIPICNELKLPVLFIGTGESMEDLAPVSVNDFIEAIFNG